MSTGINKLSDQDIDEILATVERTLEQAPNLAKSTLRKDGQPEMEPSEPEAGQEPAAPAPEMSAEPAAPAPSPEAAPEAPEAAPGEQGPDEALEHEGQDQPLSDEELDQIYGSMPPEELERHYMAMRKFLEQQGGAEEPQAEPPAPEAPQAPEAPAMPPEEPAAKSEKESSEVKALKAEIESLKKGMEMTVKAVEKVLQPTRRSVAGIEFIRKNEEMESGKTEENLDGLTKSEVSSRIKAIGPAALSKSEREQINNYLLNDKGKEKVLDIIKSKGSK